MRNIHVILFLSLSAFTLAHTGYSRKSFCLDEIESYILSLECPSNQLIKLGRIIYGYSWSNDCSYIDKDCTMDVPREDILCSSINNCTVQVVEHPLILQDCWNLAASYVQAEYECVPDYSIQDICQSRDVTSTSGFLSTPMYPNGFLSNLNCPCSLVASPGHSVVLEIIHFHLPTCAEAGLILWFGQEFQTKCLTHSPIILISTADQNVTLRFYSLKSMAQGGFLMKYSVSPESNQASVRLQCYSSSNLTRSTLPAIKSSIAMQHTFAPELRNEFFASTPSDFAKKLRPALQNANLLPNSSPSTNINMTLIIIFIVVIVVFLLVMNVLIWFMCTSRSKSSKSTSSLQNLYSQPTLPHNELVNPSNRLKTLHSLLYTNHKPSNVDPLPMTYHREIDSVLSEYPIATNASSVNLDHGFIIKSKSSETLDQPRQINSWDDI
ncbi:unnamed protein product [Adineta ricciae]|uniref:CUB domain-containing protein n=1 Tax=Adineta ricciae TaxID=249248 RepID=A0A815ETE6_ADIRI|nr:unnamed protein product [Adineta ricciae]